MSMLYAHLALDREQEEKDHMRFLAKGGQCGIMLQIDHLAPLCEQFCADTAVFFP